MNTLTANDIKTRGLSAIKKSLLKDDEAIITIRGKAEYAVVKIEKLEKYHEYELDFALAECKKDISEGHYHTDIVKHISKMEKALKNK